jgi:hypothetical protein
VRCVVWFSMMCGVEWSGMSSGVCCVVWCVLCGVVLCRVV